jgi:hypothetical protein
MAARSSAVSGGRFGHFGLSVAVGFSTLSSFRGVSIVATLH